MSALWLTAGRISTDSFDPISNPVSSRCSRDGTSSMISYSLLRSIPKVLRRPSRPPQRQGPSSHPRRPRNPSRNILAPHTRQLQVLLGMGKQVTLEEQRHGQECRDAPRKRSGGAHSPHRANASADDNGRERRPHTDRSSPGGVLAEHGSRCNYIFYPRPGISMGTAAAGLKGTLAHRRTFSDGPCVRLGQRKDGELKWQYNGERKGKNVKSKESCTISGAAIN